MASGTAEVANPLLAFILQVRIIHEGSVCVRRRFLFLLRDQECRDVFGVFGAETQAWHHGHVLHLQFVTIVRAPAVLETPLIREAFLRIILGADILLLVRAIRTRTLAGVMNPADEIIVVRFFSDASQVCGESATMHLIAFTDRVAGEAPASFKEFFAVGGVARFVLGKRVSEARLPDERRDGL